mgnify:CR=1 FL=1
MDLYNTDTQAILERISRHCPDALSAYLQCLNRANSQGTVYFSRELVEIDMSEGWHRFKNNIKKLARENILEWHPFNDGIHITLAAFDENE